MKIVCEDYGCGTSAAFADYGIANLVHCSAQNHKHIFDITGEDLFFVGHEFLMYLWDDATKVRHWQNYKNRKIVWCFEKIDCVVPQWQQKSHWSLERCQKFTDEFVASDEQDCRKYGIMWLPQWASRRFYDQRAQEVTDTRTLFSGQSGVLGYDKRDALFAAVSSDPRFHFTNNTRNKSWDDYITNLLSHKVVLAPFGNLKAFNTRTFEVLTSGRVLLQQVDEEYRWHTEMLSQYGNVKFFTTAEELTGLLDKPNDTVADPTKQFNDHNLHQRFAMIGLSL